MLSGVDEFLSTCNSTCVTRPHEAATIRRPRHRGTFQASHAGRQRGRARSLTADDAMPATASAAGAGTAEELLLTLSGPHPAELRATCQ
ncbi:hypothetical protein GCM10017687_10500 [Streptomyces echinatus]